MFALGLSSFLFVSSLSGVIRYRVVSILENFKGRRVCDVGTLPIVRSDDKVILSVIYD